LQIEIELLHSLNINILKNNIKNKVYEKIFNGELPLHVVSLKMIEKPKNIIKTKSKEKYKTNSYLLFYNHREIL
jgi:hypothetical protein